jgi:tRNA-dihydrouridine synthase B
VRALPGGEAFRAHMNTLDTCDAQVRAVTDFFEQLAASHERLPVGDEETVHGSDENDTDPLAAELAACHAH